MVNSTNMNTNVTIQVNRTAEILRTAVSIAMFLFYAIFMYFMVIILNVFFTNPQVRETTRYIFFIHMLLNDMVYLLTTIYIFLFTIYFVTMPVSICFIVMSFTTSAFCVTPYNLAVMSLERYAAICHPLRHVEIWTARRATFIIACMWIAGMIPQLANFIVYSSSVDVKAFSLNVICHWKYLVAHQSQELIKMVNSILGFSLVGLIIVYTYIRVMLVARKMGANQFASKAAKTVLLHAFQLLLSMMSFNSYFTSNFQYMPTINFFLFMSIPRFLSPVIYGARDEVFGKSMRRFCSTVRIHIVDK
ncbi:odorant receptor 131-2-like [Engystomops pustulosus]|uniref:odorant receptor 131-2-like n=1 Tax=Engystomops pustulosus TaxID=76066 RepID=UPI003AFB5069